jgi:flagellin-like protein
MDLWGLCTEDDAISPVVGVVVMIAVVVMLAAVVATFLTDFGNRGERAPQVNFEYEYDGEENLTIRVAGGDTFNSDRVSVDAFNSSLVLMDGSGLGEHTGSTWTEADDSISGPVTVTSGDQVTLDDIRDPTFELDIVWVSSDSDRSAIIGSATGPAP